MNLIAQGDLIEKMFSMFGDTVRQIAENELRVKLDKEYLERLKAQLTRCLGTLDAIITKRK